MKTVITATAICLTLVACSTASSVKPTASSDAAAAPAPQVASPAQVSPVPAPETEAQRTSRLQAELAKNSVYFDFDDFSLKSQYQGTVKQDADFMSQHAKDKVVVQGNADERGSREYNLALGQKRAETVRKALEVMGVPNARIEAISFGAEKPRATCQEEKCWQENRRVDFVHQTD